MASVAAALVGGVLSEPFKMVGKRMAVEAVKATGHVGLRVTVGRLMGRGVGEFWRGFPRKSLRLGVAAVVSRAVVQQLRDGTQVPKEICVERRFGVGRLYKANCKWNIRRQKVPFRISSN